MPDDVESAAIDASAFWLGTHASALSGLNFTVQFIGSIVACDRKGVA